MNFIVKITGILVSNNSGESGAGKTENTKKVIAYYANIGASSKKSEKKGVSIFLTLSNI